MKEYNEIEKCIQYNLKWKKQNIKQYNSTLIKYVYACVYVYTHMYISIVHM